MSAQKNSTNAMRDNDRQNMPRQAATRPGPGPGPGFGRHGPGMPVEKAKDFKGTLRRLVKFLSPHRAKLIIVLILAMASTLFTIAAPRVTGEAMNKLKDGYVAKNLVQSMIPVQEALSTEFEAELEQNTALNAAERAQIEAFEALPSLAEASDGEAKAAILSQLFTLMPQLPQMPTNPSAEMGEPDPANAPANAPAGNPGAAITDSMTPEQLTDALRAVAETGGRIDFSAIGTIAAILLAMYLLSAGFSLATGLVMSGVAQKTVYDLRKRVDEKLERLPLSYFDKRTHGEILSRMTNDVDTISGTLQQSLTQLITAVVQILGFVIMMLTISPQLTLIVLVTLPLYVFATLTVTKRSQKFFAAQQKAMGQLSGHVEEMYSGHRIVRAFGQEADSIQKFTAVNTELYDAGWKAQFVSGTLYPVMGFISNLAYVVIAVAGGLFMTRSVLNLGDVMAFIQYSRSFNHPIVQTANIANVVQSTIACAERVFEVLDEAEELSPAGAADSPASQPQAQTCGAVALEDISFRYVDSEPLIDHMSLMVEPGHTIAIVGPTGAGKTTLVNLLMRFYELRGGRITIDGQDISKMSREALRSRFGMVLQDTWLFNGTIRDNIAYGRQSATEAEIVEAAQAAHADHFIRTLPDGYDTILNEEASNISQGQKQLLTIARAILSNPAILILDEATSSVDTRTEHLIQKAMNRLMENRTSFVIAHRLSTIREAEAILVMNHGTIVEIGTHDELLMKGGFYADLYQSQFAGAMVEASA
ncbi:ABC transporter ATP-binding protein [Acidaminobacter hydrogenoformans]|uniref:ATP-binding cassette, subfamily B n=1 Tax=Acidaminobacter hydrogenoformans DSM 2784 TaxID=1120920 RepID=A0A1G5RZ13_9FIRM|nr:ABC transporter ATP-binding protein [Acidaminobacter hydrogenoformans]SCZ79364.1 ATP-binding cassette, subfamily B [Acidaminobacter hydrogenoformans DSM 2784]